MMASVQRKELVIGMLFFSCYENYEQSMIINTCIFIIILLKSVIRGSMYKPCV